MFLDLNVDRLDGNPNFMTSSFSPVNEKEIECYYTNNNGDGNNENRIEKSKKKRTKKTIREEFMKKKGRFEDIKESEGSEQGLMNDDIVWRKYKTISFSTENGIDRLSERVSGKKILKWRMSKKMAELNLNESRWRRDQQNTESKQEKAMKYGDIITIIYLRQN